LNGDKRYSQRQLNVDLLFGPLRRFRQSLQKLKRISKISNRFDVGGVRERALPGFEPAVNGLLVMGCFLMMIRQDLGLIFGELWKVIL
jgi:hypothetical protein